MRLGIGSESLSSFINNPDKLMEFCGNAQDFGYEFIDTSPFYHNALIDKTLGRDIIQKTGITVVGKAGLPFVDLGKARNRIAAKLSKRDLRFCKKSLGWESGFNPESLSDEISKSLKRFNLNCHDTFLLHSVPPELNLEPFITQLKKEQSLGRIRRIGLSIDVPTKGSFEWADVLQVPTSLRNNPRVKQFTGTIIFNGIFRENGDDAHKVLGELIDNFPTQSLVIGSRNIEHLREISQVIRGN